MKKLYFITETYTWDKSFWRHELATLKKEYDVRFVSTGGPEEIWEEDKDMPCFFYEEKSTKLTKVKYMFKYFFDKRCSIERRNIAKEDGLHIGKILTHLFRSIEYYTYAGEFYKWFISNVYEKDDEAIYYTYWCNYYLLSMILNKDKYKDMKVVSRIHRFDLYNDQFPGGRQPFKSTINKLIDKMFFVSQNSLDYYKDCYRIKNDGRFVLNRLGTKPLLKPDNLISDSDKFILVSCSNMLPVKRVDYIAKALSKVSTPVHWIHFGGGELMDDIRKTCRDLLDGKSNISYELKGMTPNDDIREYYRTHRIDAFINVSESEGAPVSIMEAMSVGIPVIATNVGEASIMVDGNGVLLESNPEIQQIADAIERLVKASKDYADSMSSKSLELWKSMFDVDNNIKSLLNILAEESK